MTDLVGGTGPGTSPEPEPGDAAGDGDSGSRTHHSGSGRRRAGHGKRGKVSDPGTSPGQSGRDLRAATAVGLGLATIVLGLLFLWKPAFVGLVVVVMIVAVWELAQALSQKGIRLPIVPILLGTPIMLAGAYAGGETPLLVGLALTVTAVCVWRLGDHHPGYGRDVVAGIFAAVYVPFLAGFAVLMLRSSDDGAWQVFALLAVVVASDTGGYFLGSMIGRHPMAPTVSPKKSWEGLLGSIVLAQAVALVLTVVVFDGPLWAGALLGVVGVIGGTLGDLGESLIKRDIGVKDMSNLLPGHGGLMDRLDSLLPTAPLLWMVFTYTFG